MNNRTGTISQSGSGGFNFRAIFIALILITVGLLVKNGYYMIHEMVSSGCNHKFREVINPNFGINTTFTRVETCQICGTVKESKASLSDYTKFKF